MSLELVQLAMRDAAPWLALAVLVGYLLGSIPFGLLLTRAAGLGDVRKIGSGNIGATNVLRTGSKKLAAATLLLDGLKGTAAVLAGSLIASYALNSGMGGDGHIATAAIAMTYVTPVAGVAAFLGHLFPVWLGFKGGKGVATYIGVLAGLYWPAALVFCATWLLIAFTLKYSSLSALIASLAAPAFLAWRGEYLLAVIALFLTALLLWKHRGNISRLKAGTEPRIGAKG